MNEPSKTQQPSGTNYGALFAISIFLLLGALYWRHSRDEAREELQRQQEQQKQEREEERKERARAAALERYSALMQSMSKKPPATLKHVTDDMGRKADTCQRTDNLQMDVCYWFVTEDQATKVFSYTLAADGMAGTDPDKWVKLVVFARNDKVEKKIDGAIQQLIEQK